MSPDVLSNHPFKAELSSPRARRACALRALGLLLADVAPTVGRGKVSHWTPDMRVPKVLVPAPKKIELTRQKVFPLPTVGAPSASNSPSALSARAG